MKRVMLFRLASYLANPRDENDTPSILTVLGINTTTGANAGLGFNSVASSTWRMEGLKRYGRHTFSFNVPIGYYYNRRSNPYTGNRGDATFRGRSSSAATRRALRRRALPCGHRPRQAPDTSK